jgi:hypothetical protein
VLDGIKCLWYLALFSKQGGCIKRINGRKTFCYNLHSDCHGTGKDMTLRRINSRGAEGVWKEMWYGQAQTLEDTKGVVSEWLYYLV